MRLPYQVLIIPFIKEKNDYYYAVFKRKDLAIWQFIAGGGEDSENPLQTAEREIREEISIEGDCVRLATVNTVPAANIRGLMWGKDIVIIPEFAFGIECFSRDIKISKEHTEYLWLTRQEALKKVKYDSNKTALWELDYRLKNNNLKGTEKNVRFMKKLF